MDYFQDFRLVDVLDIALVSVIIYYSLQWLKGSRAVQLLKGIFALAVLFGISKIFHLMTIEWLLAQMATIIFILLIVVFQPELRRGLEQIGRHFAWQLTPRPDSITLVNRLSKTVDVMSEQKLGALIIIERTTGLNEYIEGGIAIDALVSPELLLAIFCKKSPVHDGAVIIRHERLAAASCLLPLSELNYVHQKLGTRHRAAIGLTEASDAIAIVVSEATGGVAVAENGILTRCPNKESFNTRLLESLKN